MARRCRGRHEPRGDSGGALPGGIRIGARRAAFRAAAGAARVSELGGRAARGRNGQALHLPIACSRGGAAARARLCSATGSRCGARPGAPTRGRCRDRRRAWGKAGARVRGGGILVGAADNGPSRGASASAKLARFCMAAVAKPGFLLGATGLVRDAARLSPPARPKQRDARSRRRTRRRRLSRGDVALPLRGRGLRSAATATRWEAGAPMAQAKSGSAAAWDQAAARGVGRDQPLRWAGAARIGDDRGTLRAAAAQGSARRRAWGKGGRRRGARGILLGDRGRRASAALGDFGCTPRAALPHLGWRRF
jgi:hypothetical protein